MPFSVLLRFDVETAILKEIATNRMPEVLRLIVTGLCVVSRLHELFQRLARRG
jgi:hypothetical protein